MSMPTIRSPLNEQRFNDEKTAQEGTDQTPGAVGHQLPATPQVSQSAVARIILQQLFIP